MRIDLCSLVAAAAFSASQAIACGFHTYVPQPTLVDRLLVSDHIVLARPDPEDPFRFVATSSIEGPIDEVELPHLVDSTTRKRMAANPDSHVLFARDGAYGPWQRIAYIDEDMAPVLNQVTANLAEWSGVDSDRGRYEYFAGLINSQNIGVRRLALRELDQASYGVFRSLEIEPDPDSIRQRLGLLTENDLAPIRILLLGLSDAPEVGGLLQAGVDRNKGSGASAFLGAYATAWVEHSGSDAARRLASEYLLDDTLPYPSREMIVEALAIHAETGDAGTSEAVRDALSSALRADAELAPAVARQFGIRNDWSLSLPISEVLYGNKLTSMTDIILVSQYVALADEATLPTAN